jgi:LuxR family maltose regulon positive regulatory protein
VRIFVGCGPQLADLLREAVARGIEAAYAGRLLAAFEAEAPGPEDVGAGGHPGTSERGPHTPGTLVEPLSDRELEVLRLVAEGLSNREIAQALYISLRTVKWHTGNIYGKLGVKSRTQAVARARTLGVLPAD